MYYIQILFCPKGLHLVLLLALRATRSTLNRITFTLSQSLAQFQLLTSSSDKVTVTWLTWRCNHVRSLN